MLSDFNLKTDKEIKIMAEGGRKLSEIKHKLANEVHVGGNAYEIDKLADDLIAKSGGEASFKKVPGYYWATCINVNAGIVHGIPKKELVFKKGDLVSIDVGLFYKGFHTDTSISVGLNLTTKHQDFLDTGKAALKKAISQMKVDNRVYDISKAMEDTIKNAGYSPVESLVGHGVGKFLHEEPQIPCFVYDKRKNTPELQVGMVLAIEVMYTEGSPELVHEEDGWTIATADGKISGLFEETVALTKHGFLVLT